MNSYWGPDCKSYSRFSSHGSYADYQILYVLGYATPPDYYDPRPGVTSIPVRITLESSTDTYLYLYKREDNGSHTLVASDDDSGTGTNSQLTATLTKSAYVIESGDEECGDG